ncbi:uncharacterized protein LOC110848098 [Folsomia candida]|uniref:Collagen alpha-5(VI) chain n=1 Tax=Folsomia candida TaxID=158441 RepID=A0A226EW23_FOLCA|nr:uncharacterized protein LOC110848098 [Folsomia candida]OXA61782.1 Collagen alpha-5(VI) chain [Folsomia candida]
MRLRTSLDKTSRNDLHLILFLFGISRLIPDTNCAQIRQQRELSTTQEAKGQGEQIQDDNERRLQPGNSFHLESLSSSDMTAWCKDLEESEHIDVHNEKLCKPYSQHSLDQPPQVSMSFYPSSCSLPEPETPPDFEHDSNLLNEITSDLVPEKYPSSQATLILSNSKLSKSSVALVTLSDLASLRGVFPHNDTTTPIILSAIHARFGPPSYSSIFEVIPRTLVHPTSHQVFYELPEFSGNRGPKANILSTFYTRKLTDQLTFAKLLFTIPHSAFKNKESDQFDSLLNHAVPFLAHNVAHYTGKMGLVVTDVTTERGQSDEIILQDISSTMLTHMQSLLQGLSFNYLTSEDRLLIEEKAKFIENLHHEGGSYISLLLSPEKCGSLDKDAKIVKAKQDIDTLLKQLGDADVSDKSTSFAYNVSLSTAEQVHEMGVQANAKITEEFASYVTTLRRLGQLRDHPNTSIDGILVNLYREYYPLETILIQLNNEDEHATTERIISDVSRWSNFPGFEVDLPATRNILRVSSFLDFLILIGREIPSVGQVERKWSEWIEPIRSYDKGELKTRMDWYKLLSDLSQSLDSYYFHARKPVGNDDENPEPEGMKAFDLAYPYFHNESYLGPAEVQKILDSKSLTAFDRNWLKKLVHSAWPKPKIICNEDQDGLIVRGNYIKVTDFTDVNSTSVKNPCSKKLKSISILATRKFFIDSDLTILGVKQVSIIAPIWDMHLTRDDQIVSGFHFKFDGEDGIPWPAKVNRPSTSILFGFKGEDGYAGRPGNPGAYFVGVVGHWEQSGGEHVSPVPLYISVNGGNGSHGQQGEKGGEGKKGDDATDKTLQDVEKASIVASHCWDNNHNVPSCTNRGTLGHDGTKGGNGGNGGVGGKGGFPGDVVIHTVSRSPKDPEVIVSMEQGSTGDPGWAGEAGLGGLQGDRVECENDGRSWVNCVNYGVYTRQPDGSKGTWNVSTTNQQEPAHAEQIIEGYRLLGDWKADAFLQLPEPDIDINCDLLTDWFYRSGKAYAYELVGYQKKILNLQDNTENQNARIESVLTSFSSRLEAFANYTSTKNASNPTWVKEEKKVLATLYSSTLSTISRLRETDSSADMVFDLARYAGVITTTLNELKDLEEKKVVEKSRAAMSSTFKQKISQALSFISDTVGPALLSVRTELKHNTDFLLSSIINAEEDAKDEVEKAKKRLQKMKDLMPFRYLLTGLEFTGQVASFFGAQGALAGSAIGTFTAFSKEFSGAENADSSVRPLLNVPTEALDFLTQTETYTKETYDKEKEKFDKMTEQADKAIKESGDLVDDLQDLPQKIEEIKKKAADMDKNSPLDFSVFKNTYSKRAEELQELMKTKTKRLDQLLKDQEAKPLSEPDKKKLDANLKSLNRVKNGFNLITGFGLDNYNKLANEYKNLDELGSEVEKAQGAVENLKAFESSINRNMIPIMAKMNDEMAQLYHNLEHDKDKSQVSLRVTQWKVQGSLRDYKNLIKRFTKGQAVEESILTCVDKLDQAMTLLIDLYDFIEKYEDQSKLVDYIAAVNSKDVLTVGITDLETASWINLVTQASKSNLLIEQYDKFMTSFKQWVFPFANKYLAKFTLPDSLQLTDKNSSFLVSKLNEKISTLKQDLDTYQSSIVKEDTNLITLEFDPKFTSGYAFYVWENERWNAAIRSLLKGAPITLTANSEYGVKKGFAAVKFVIAEISLRSKVKREQGKLDDLLKHFKVEMVHSGVSRYQFGGESYQIPGPNITIAYHFERDPDTHLRLGRNEVYKKFAAGDSIMSPYTLWTFQLFLASDTASFSDLEVYADYVDLELVGSGVYVDEANYLSKGGVIGDLHLEKYYAREYASTPSK